MYLGLVVMFMLCGFEVYGKSCLGEECLGVFYVAKKNGHMIVDNHVPVVVIVDSDLYA